MKRRLMIMLLAFSVPASQVLAGDLNTSVRNAVAKELASQTAAPAGRSENPYMIPGLVLLGVGGIVLIYGAVHETGADCSISTSSIKCGTTHSTGVIVAGAAIAGVGGFLLWKGEKEKKTSPELVSHAGGIMLRQRIRW